MQISLVIDIVLVVLVAAGIFFAWRLQRALATLQQNRQAMEGFISSFATSITRAEKALAELGGTARTLSGDVEEQMKKAGALRDELTFLVDAADKVATRLTEQTTQASGVARQARKEAFAEDDIRKPAPPLPPVAESKAPPAAPQGEPAAAPPPWMKRLEDDSRVINKLPNPVAAPPSEPPVARPAVAAKQERPRSQAERELQQALEKIR